MTLCFTLTMPRNNSWNGKWSGDERFYAVLKSFVGKRQEAKAAEIIAKGPYYYNWPDGWGAKISVHQVDAAESRKVRKNSKGFCGYEWMVRTIIDYGKPLADHEIPEREAVGT